MISSSWKDSTPSEYGKVAEILPIVGTVGSTLVTYDNGMVLDVLVSCLNTTRHMSDLKPFQNRRDGRGALAALELHNMGNSKWNLIVSEAESKVLTFKWNGENSQYTLARHISSHRSAQNDMVRAEDHIGYQPPN